MYARRRGLKAADGERTLADPKRPAPSPPRGVISLRGGGRSVDDLVQECPTFHRQRIPAMRWQLTCTLRVLLPRVCALG